MTKNKACHVDEYNYSQQDWFVLDTNIWLYLFPAPSSPSQSLTSIYSKVYKDILGVGSRVAIGSTILSEYLNRYCRIEFDALYKNNYKNFKEFRKSDDFLDVAEVAGIFAENILKNSTVCSDDFSVANITSVLSDFQSGKLDFNDGVILDSCRRNGWKLVTHDSDFIVGGIEVLTSNKRLLAACQ